MAKKLTRKKKDFLITALAWTEFYEEEDWIEHFGLTHKECQEALDTLTEKLRK